MIYTYPNYLRGLEITRDEKGGGELSARKKYWITCVLYNNFCKESNVRFIRVWFRGLILGRGCNCTDADIIIMYPQNHSSGHLHLRI